MPKPNRWPETSLQFAHMPTIGHIPHQFHAWALHRTRENILFLVQEPAAQVVIVVNIYIHIAISKPLRCN